MPKMRVMSWVLFTLSFAFFFVQDFRWALCLPYLETKKNWDASGIPQEELLALAERAKQQRDAQSLAFAALNLPAGDQEVALADQAVAMDPSLTWIYYHVSDHHHPNHGWEKPAFAAVLKGWVAKLQAFDPQNAVPYLLEAQIILDRTKDFPILSPPFTPEKGAAISQQADWVAAMEKAFSSPRYDSYATRRFDLDRKVLLANGWARPDRLVADVVTYTVPNVLNIRYYATYKVQYLAPQAEEQKHHEEALRHYYQTALFGQRMQVEGGTLLEEWTGLMADRIASEPLEAELKKAGQNDKADLVSFSHRRFLHEYIGSGSGNPVAASSNQLWAILIAHISAFLVAFFAGATLLCTLYLNAKRRIRVHKRGRIFQFVTGAVNYLAVLLFVSCLMLFLTYVPYATNYHIYMEARGKVRNLDSVFTNVYPYLESTTAYLEMELRWRDPNWLLVSVHHYLHWAAIGLVLLALLGWLKKRYAAASAPPAPAK